MSKEIELLIALIESQSDIGEMEQSTADYEITQILLSAGGRS